MIAKTTAANVKPLDQAVKQAAGSKQAQVLSMLLKPAGTTTPFWKDIFLSPGFQDLVDRKNRKA